jgi:2-dehydro-3-deoxyphosphogluconate aldolase/(4S)-4-hydroxy-2-oxoglutarate aldolase
MKSKEIGSCIEELGIIPAVRVSSAADARFAAESVFQGGIPIVEISMVVPGAIHVISDLVKHSPKMIIGAGGILDKKTAYKCIEAGAQFLTTDALDVEVVEFAAKEGITVLPGALTPTEVLMAWKAGADFVKIVPCAQVGGAGYIKALKAPFPQIPLIAAGGVNQQTATGFILAGAAALGIGGELIPRESIVLRQSGRIGELCRRFLNFVAAARREAAEKIPAVPVQVELRQMERPLVMQGDYS